MRIRQRTASGSRSGRRTRGGLALLAAGLLAAGFLAAGCSADESDGGASSETAPRAASGVGSADSASSAGAKGAAAANAALTNTKVTPRALIRTAELTVRVHDVPNADNRAGAIARANGGDTYDDNRTGSGQTARADLVLKVDPDSLSNVLGQLAALGKEEQRSTSTKDVTEQVADVESRLASMRASIARVRTLLDRATSVRDLASLEGELSQRETDLESLEARQRALADQVQLATVTVHLVASATPAAVHHARRGFVAGLGNGWDAFTATLTALLTALGAVLPFAAVAAVILLAWWRIGRRPRHPAPPAAAVTADAGGGAASP